MKHSRCKERGKERGTTSSKRYNGEYGENILKMMVVMRDSDGDNAKDERSEPRVCQSL